jgi:sulfatase modifying factor 1
MAGNVREWVFGRYDANYYAGSPDRNPQGPGSGEIRVLRGGSWLDTQRNARCTYRSRYLPLFLDYYVGFRAVVAPVPSGH